ncbi:hypothetical protein I7I50_00383 [Histoplasma capsulatum G186AR]|uniref:Uncharacterized protein n=1 Tax=Ajellomyces capsulatus TaxID=5037 RepID=A0A8H7YDV1_AJECA|nr:hypothetical protein I7I52_07651 [Histoplasma capsulatum]QSS72517.1 hypothetical protein I7I50_00383 [Histoplasma capsulatum G186AR]
MQLRNSTSHSLSLPRSAASETKHDTKKGELLFFLLRVVLLKLIAVSRSSCLRVPVVAHDLRGAMHTYTWRNRFCVNVNLAPSPIIAKRRPGCIAIG